MAPSRASSSAVATPSETVAKNIRQAREERELTQREFARLVSDDLDPLAISRWERGVNRPTDANLSALADALELPFAWFFTDHDGDLPEAA